MFRRQLLARCAVACAVLAAGCITGVATGLVVTAILLAAASPASAEVISVNLGLVPPGPNNVITFTITGEILGSQKSDSENSNVTGNMLADLGITFDPLTQAATSVDTLESTGGHILLGDMSFTLDWGFIIGRLDVTSASLGGTFDTPVPPGHVFNFQFNTNEHEVILNEGTFTASGTGLIGSFLNPNPYIIDLSVEPMRATTDAIGTITVSPPTIVEETATYTATLTLPMVIDELIFDEPGTGWMRVGGSGTLVSSGQFTRVVPANQWSLEVGGSYNDFRNWTHKTVPNGLDAVANFLSKINSNSTITVDSPVTLGTINFDNANSYTLAGPAEITLQASSGDARINVLKGSHTISSPVSLAGDLTVDTAAETTLSFTHGSLRFVIGGVTKEGLGKWVLDGGILPLGEINVNNGTLQVRSGLLAMPGGDVNIAAGATLKTAGAVSRNIVAADPTAMIVATGPLTLGDQGSAGYNFAGILDVGAHPVTVLGPPGTPPTITTALLGGGTLTGSPELKVAPAVGIIYGTGKVTGTVQLGEALDPAALVSGIDDSQRLELSGLVRGNAPAAYVDFTGYGPTGFSPAYFFAGHNSYATAVFEIRGTAPGQVIYDPGTDANTAVAGEYSQYQVVGDAAGPGSSTTFMSLALNKSPGYEWTDLEPGDLDLIFAAEARLKIGFPPKSTNLQAGMVAYGPGFMADLNSQLASINANLAPLGKQMLVTQFDASGLTLTVVPEPGTLVLLLSGGLGLVLPGTIRRMVGRRSQIRKAASAVS